MKKEIGSHPVVPRKSVVVGIFKDKREVNISSGGGREVEYTIDKGKSVL